MKCKNCGKQHANSKCTYVLDNKIKDDGFPTHPKKPYQRAHREADKKEKAKFGARDYDKLKRIDNKLPKHELAGKNTRSGKIEVSKKVAPKLRPEVAYHEMVENYKLRHKKK